MQVHCRIIELQELLKPEQQCNTVQPHWAPGQGSGPVIQPCTPQHTRLFSLASTTHQRSSSCADSSAYALVLASSSRTMTSMLQVSAASAMPGQSRSAGRMLPCTAGSQTPVTSQAAQHVSKMRMQQCARSQATRCCCCRQRQDHTSRGFSVARQHSLLDTAAHLCMPC